MGEWVVNRLLGESSHSPPGASLISPGSGQAEGVEVGLGSRHGRNGHTWPGGGPGGRHYGDPNMMKP